MSSARLRFVEIDSLEHPLLVPWCDLYEQAFPAAERMLVADILRLVKRKACGESADSHLIAVTDGAGEFAALAHYDLRRELSTACLWYLAVLPKLRSRGFGSRTYRQIMRQVKAAGAWGAVFEVEIPEEAHSEEVRSWAVRRIGFYRRLGARLLAGISYTQSVGSHQTPIPMHLMVHAFEPLTAQEAYRRARRVCKDSLKRRRGEQLRLQ